MSNQELLRGINLSGLTQLEQLKVHNNALLCHLLGVKDLLSLKDVNLSGNSLTYDQLPLFTAQLQEVDVNYDQNSTITLDSKHVKGLSVDLSFLLHVYDTGGVDHVTTFPNVRFTTNAKGQPSQPILSDQYSYSEGVFTFPDAIFKKEDGSFAQAVWVGIETKNDYYPNYAIAAETNQIVAKIERSQQPTPDDKDMATLTLAHNEGGTLSVYIVSTGADLVSGDKVKLNSEVGVNSELKTGYQVDYYEVNGKRVHEADQYFFFVRITQDTKIEAFYKPIPKEGYAVEYSTSEGGELEKVYYYNSEGRAVDLKTGGHVPAASLVTLRSKAKPGYELDYWLLNGEKEPANGELLSIEIFRNTEVKASCCTSV